MFWSSKKNVFEDWVIIGCGYMAEHDRVYDNIVAQHASDLNPQSNENIAGKFLFRSFAVVFVQAGSALQKKLNQSYFDDLHAILTSIMLHGTTVLENQSGALSRVSSQKELIVDSIPLDKLELLHGVGAKFMDSALNSFVRYCAGQEKIAKDLVNLYFQSLEYPIKNLDKNALKPQAMGMFAGARAAIMKKI